MQKTKTISPLVAGIAEKIEANLPVFAANGVLPGLRSLAKHFDVSRPTVTSAVRLLVAKGLLRGSPCRKVEVAVPREIVRVGSPSEEFRSWLITEVETGRYTTGEVLPKSMFFSVEWNISARAVQRIYASLARDGLIHRSRGRYYVGAPRSTTGESCKRYIALLCTKPFSWASHCGNWRIGGFGKSFTEEASRNNISLVKITVTSPPKSLPSFWGLDGISRCKARYGDRLIGALITVKRDDLSDIDLWVRSLESHTRCAVFDSENVETWVPARAHSLIRAYISEKAMVEVAIEHLYNLGHRRIAYPSFATVPWQSVRADTLKEVCAARYRQIDIVQTRLFPQEDWRLPSRTADLSEVIEVCMKSGSAAVMDALTFLSSAGSQFVPENKYAIADHWKGNPFWAVALVIIYMCEDVEPKLPAMVVHKARTVTAAMVFADIINAGACTAIIAPNDGTAIPYFLEHAMLLGIKIPEAVSICSFDNRYPYRLIPLTTVDNGAQGLGYKTLHLLLGDIQMNVEKHGAISSKPFVIDRGSTAKPGAPLAWTSLGTR